MRYILIATFAGASLDDFDDITNTSWFLGKFTNKKEMLETAKKEIDDWIEEQVTDHFDVDPDEVEDAALLEEMEYYRQMFKKSFISNVEAIHGTSSLVGEVYYCSDSYVNSLRIIAFEDE